MVLNENTKKYVTEISGLREFGLVVQVENISEHGISMK